jgi:hypothetical protein
MRIFGPKPRRQGTGVRPTDRDPFVSGRYPVPLIAFYLLNEICQVPQRLFRRKVLQVGSREGVCSEGQRLSVIAMLEGDDQRFGILCDN